MESETVEKWRELCEQAEDEAGLFRDSVQRILKLLNDKQSVEEEC